MNIVYYRVYEPTKVGPKHHLSIKWTHRETTHIYKLLLYYDKRFANSQLNIFSMEAILFISCFAALYLTIFNSISRLINNDS